MARNFRVTSIPDPTEIREYVIMGNLSGNIWPTPTRDPILSARVHLGRNGQMTLPNARSHPQILFVSHPSRPISGANMHSVCGHTGAKWTGTRLLVVRLGDAWRPSTYLHRPNSIRTSGGPWLSFTQAYGSSSFLMWKSWTGQVHIFHFLAGLSPRAPTRASIP